MKKNVFFFLLGFGFCSLLSFQKSSNQEASKSIAEVSIIDGVSIFTDSKPLSQYDELGVVELSFSSDTQYQSVRDNLIKKAKKKYPNTNGLIFDFNKKGIDKCVAIQFK
ncbi:MAG: hypothetical protein ACK46Y_03490 [Fluviicola sp.]